MNNHKSAAASSSLTNYKQSSVVPDASSSIFQVDVTRTVTHNNNELEHGTIHLRTSSE